MHRYREAAEILTVALLCSRGFTFVGSSAQTLTGRSVGVGSCGSFDVTLTPAIRFLTLQLSNYYLFQGL